MSNFQTFQTNSSSASIGLCLSKSWGLLENSNWLCINSCMLQNDLIHLHRILQYTELKDENLPENVQTKPRFDRKKERFLKN